MGLLEAKALRDVGPEQFSLCGARAPSGQTPRKAVFDDDDRDGKVLLEGSIEVAVKAALCGVFTKWTPHRARLTATSFRYTDPAQRESVRIPIKDIADVLDETVPRKRSLRLHGLDSSLGPCC